MNWSTYPAARFLDAALAHGQSTLSDDMRTVVAYFAPWLMDLLDVNEDRAFLEPLLFAYAAHPTRPVPLEQILFGYIPDHRKPKQFEVYADVNGVVEIPGIGYFLTPASNQRLKLLWKATPADCVLMSGNAIVEHSFVQPIMLPGTNIEICRYVSPLFAKLMTGANGDKVIVDLSSGANPLLERVFEAFRIIEACQPDYLSQIRTVLRRIVLYSSERPYSFATLAAHGIAFLNVSTGEDEVFLVEDLVHQCGHLIFSAMTRQREEFLQVPATHPLANITGADRETRDVYTALHGLYTEAWMSICLDSCCDLDIFSDRQRNELLGRFALILTRFGCDLRSLGSGGIFSDKGEMLFSWFGEIYRDIVSRRHELLSPLRIQNQPYCFRYTDFMDANPSMSSTTAH